MVHKFFQKKAEESCEFANEALVKFFDYMQRTIIRNVWKMKIILISIYEFAALILLILSWFIKELGSFFMLLILAANMREFFHEKVKEGEILLITFKGVKIKEITK